MLTFIHHLKTTTSLTTTTTIHSLLLKLGNLTPSNTHTCNHLISAYLRTQPTPSLSDAHHLLLQLTHPDVISFTCLMSAYSHSNLPYLSLNLFPLIPKPNSFSFATALTAASQLPHSPAGPKLHSLLLTSGLHSDLVASTALISFYSKSNLNVSLARKVFDRMPQRNVISWGAMISAYAQNAQPHDAILLFSHFLHKHPCRPNHYMLSSLVNACASLARIGCGKFAHAKVVRCLFDDNKVIAGGLIDMYAKCGCIEYAVKVFDGMADLKPSLVLYTSMISAAAKYGLASFALGLFERMVANGVTPNEVTLVGVLHACSHAGLVDSGLGYLDSMERIYGLVPSAKHYTCVVDMLGRAGRIDEAYALARRVGAEGDDELTLWSTLLSSSRIHKRLDIAMEAKERLREFNKDVAGAYMAMSNAYVAVGEWEEARRVRWEMRRRGIRKEPGCSWVEVKDVAYVFYAGKIDDCPRGNEVVELLEELEVRMEERGYVSKRRLLFIEEEEEGGGACNEMMHSEMLALGFGLLSYGKGVKIRVMKNLRMCGDCHEKFKVISEIVRREFVVRDVNRFHQFKDGACSCGDYW